MSDREYRLHNGQKGAAVGVRVTPRARRNEIVEILHDGTVRIRIAASPGETLNQELKSYLSEILGVDLSTIEVVAGLSGRDKLISVLGLDSEMLHRKILENLT